MSSDKQQLVTFKPLKISDDCSWIWTTGVFRVVVVVVVVGERGWGRGKAVLNITASIADRWVRAWVRKNNFGGSL